MNHREIASIFITLEEDEPDASTEQLLERTRQAANLQDVDEVIAALIATGTFTKS